MSGETVITVPRPFAKRSKLLSELCQQAEDTDALMFPLSHGGLNAWLLFAKVVGVVEGSAATSIDDHDVDEQTLRIRTRCEDVPNHSSYLHTFNSSSPYFGHVLLDLLALLCHLHAFSTQLGLPGLFAYSVRH